MQTTKKILVTGGAGFIGSALIRKIIQTTDHFVVNIDKLTYSGNLSSLESINNNPKYNFEKLVKEMMKEDISLFKNKY